MKCYKVTVKGDYIASIDNSEKKTTKPYEVTGNLPSMHAALSVFKNKLLLTLLQKKYPDALTYHTHHIVSVEPMGGATLSKMDIRYMSRESLISYIRENALPVEAKYYPDLFKLREAVRFADEDPEGYLTKFEARKADLQLDLDIEAMNQDIVEESPEHVPVKPTAAEEVAEAAGVTRKKALKGKAKVKNTQDRVESLRQDQIRDGEIEDVDPMEKGADVDF